MEVFRWDPMIDVEAEYDEKIKEVIFGDGYEQVAPDGLNSIRQSFNNMKFIDFEDGKTKDIKSFYLRHGRSKSFMLEITGYKGVFRFSGPLKIAERGAGIQEITLSMKESFK